MLQGKRFCKCEPPKVEACPKSKPSPKVEPKPVNPKPVGYWLLTCSGMVFVAVIIGSIVAYYTLLISICIVISEVVKKTVRS